MQVLSWGSAGARRPYWLWAAAGFGVLWNLYGLYQFVGTFSQTHASLMSAGMSAAQAEVYLALPGWVNAMFGIGVVGGLVGSLALAAGRRGSQAILAVSLAGYLVLFAADAYHGVFASIPGQLAILAFVVLVAALLLAAARRAVSLGLLR